MAATGTDVPGGRTAIIRRGSSGPTPTIALPNGEALNAEHLDITPFGDNELVFVVEVEDGTRLTAQVVASGATRVDPKDDPRGDEPIYSLDTDVHVRTEDVPGSLTTPEEDMDEQWAK